MASGMNRAERRALASFTRRVQRGGAPGAPLAVEGDEGRRVFAQIVSNSEEFFDAPDAFFEDASLRVLKECVSDLKEITMDETRTILASDERISRWLRDTIVASMKSQELASMIRSQAMQATVDVAKEIVAELMPDLEKQVRKLIVDRFEEEVGAAAKKVLAEKMAELVRRIGT